jgi:hypothetical protein
MITGNLLCILAPDFLVDLTDVRFLENGSTIHIYPNCTLLVRSGSLQWTGLDRPESYENYWSIGLHSTGLHNVHI